MNLLRQHRKLKRQRLKFFDQIGNQLVTPFYKKRPHILAAFLQASFREKCFFDMVYLYQPGIVIVFFGFYQFALQVIDGVF